MMCLQEGTLYPLFVSTNNSRALRSRLKYCCLTCCRIFLMTAKPIELPQGPMWIDNWQRLGLVRVTYKDFVISGEDSYRLG